MTASAPGLGGSRWQASRTRHSHGVAEWIGADAPRVRVGTGRRLSRSPVTRMPESVYRFCLSLKPLAQCSRPSCEFESV